MMIRSLIREYAAIVYIYIFAWSSALFRSYKDRQCEGLKAWERTASTAPRFFMSIPHPVPKEKAEALERQ